VLTYPSAPLAQRASKTILPNKAEAVQITGRVLISCKGKTCLRLKLSAAHSSFKIASASADSRKSKPSTAQRQRHSRHRHFL
jgi:hypothetical protein